jgi:hypothetical protein
MHVTLSEMHVTLSEAKGTMQTGAADERRERR